MPNHITSRLKITGDATKVAEVFYFIKADEPDEKGNYRLFDLEKIVPMPKALDIDSSSLGEDGMKYLYSMAGNVLERSAYEKSSHYAHMKDMEMNTPKMFDKAMEEGKIRLHNIANYGASDWYQWRLLNWGTKWNAFDTQVLSDDEIVFYTAWLAPMPVLRALSEMYPDSEIGLRYCDEDPFGAMGYASFANGQESDEPIIPESSEGKALYEELVGFYPSDEDDDAEE